MKILHIITNTELGGAQRVCIDLATAAINEGNKVAIASMEGGYLWNELPREAKQFQVKNMVKPISPKNDLKCFFELKKAIKEFNPDIIHLHSSKAGVLGRLASIFNSRRIVYTVHGFDSIRLKHRIFLPFERILQHFCGAIVPVSYYDEKNLRSEKITRNLHVIQNGVRLNCSKKELFIPAKKIKGRKIVMTIARISPPKKIQMFLEVAKSLPEYFFVWIGGEAGKDIDETRSEYDASENVFLAGDIPDASSYLHLCDLFVLFSNFEGLPMTIIEAMSQSKPVVASNAGGIPELVDESNGFLVDTTGSACSAIKKILENPLLADQMGKSSYKKFLADYTLESMWGKYKKIYQILAKNKEKQK